MALTKVDKSVSSTPGIVDNSDATAITIDSSEFVGVGTTSPTQRLHIDSGNALIKSSYDASGTTNSYLYFAARTSGDWRNSTIGNTGNSLVFSTGGTGTTHTNATERMRILSNGNVGIAETSPAEKLHVNGVIRSKAQKTENMQMFNIASGTYTAGTYYNFTTRSVIGNLGYGSGFYIWHIYDDTYLAGGGNYFINYCSEPFYFANVATNAANTMEFGMNSAVAFGHAANGGAASRVKLRLVEEYGASGADSDIQWAWNGNNNLTIDQTAGKRIYIYLHKIGGD